MTPRRRRRAILACLTLALLCPAAAQAARPFELGFYDRVFMESQSSVWLGRSVAAGADIVKIDIGWVAPDTRTRPPGFDARNPADPNYDFSHADAAIRQATADGLRVILSFEGAPMWAEGPGMPSDADPGTWRPDPQAVGDYGLALARRYSGHFPDPSNPAQMLPRATALQMWNEPNLSKYLAPQWSGNHTAAPELYRRMLNAFYSGVKSVDPNMTVVTAGTAPFGDPEPGGLRIMPVRFWRDALCVRQVGSGLQGTGCKDPAHFDVLAHHPYSVGSPDTLALNPDDVSIPDLGKLTRVLRAAERTGGALPRKHHQLWVTEVGYNTAPPNPGGVPIVEDARWVAQTLELLWSQGVDVVTWNTIVDQPPIPSYATTSQSGVFFVDGRRKPAFQAFRFPLVAWHTDASTVQVWGRSPDGGRLAIQRRAGGVWRTVKTLNVSAHSTFLAQIKRTGGAKLRAKVGHETSLTWVLG